jgi:hypothetical protein
VKRRVAALVAAASCVCAAAGCGLGAGDEQGGAGAQIRVTRDFGHHLVGAAHEDAVREDQTVMRFLHSDFDVGTSDGGRFVQSIEGLKGAGSEGQKDWFFWVNGVESDRGAADYEVKPGARVQWDYRDWSASMRVPAIVGAFPQPLDGGWEDKRRPVRLECEESSSKACTDVKKRLDGVGIPVSESSIGAPYTETVIRVLVGRWPALRQSVSLLEDGPKDSGVFATFAKDGRSLALLDGAGDTAREVEPGDGTGIVAALFPRTDQLSWVITGLDQPAVDSAADALSAKRLRDAFAVAVTGSKTEKLPLEVP